MDAIKAYVRCHIRWMIRRDLPEVLAIENASFAHPWTEEEFLVHLRERTIIGMVAEYGGRVVGYFIYQLHKDRLDVLFFAVHPEFDRQGVDCQMVEKLKSKLSGHRRTLITLTVRETNVEAQLFFRAQGLLAVDVLREHYPDTGEDGYAMEYLLDEDGAERWRAG